MNRRETIASCCGIALSIIISAFLGGTVRTWAEHVSTIHGDIHPFGDLLGLGMFVLVYFLLPRDRRTLYTSVRWRAVWTAWTFAISGWSSVLTVVHAFQRKDWLVVGYHSFWVALSVPATLWMVRTIRTSILIRVRLHRAAKRRQDLEQFLFQGAPYVINGQVLGHEEIKAIEP